jgi:DNA-binding GntR family transcriptional regulator
MEQDSVQELPTGPTSLTDQAVAAISQMIRNRQLRGGEVIVEQRLAEHLGLSRTPLREALQRLEGEGLVVRSNGRSVLVRHVDLREYMQSLKVREILEPEAAALSIGRFELASVEAARHEIFELRQTVPYDANAHWRSDATVHQLFIDNCGNDVLIRSIRALRTTTHLFEVMRLYDRLEPDSTEHLAILDALERGDAKAVRKTVQQHIRSLMRFALLLVA